MSAWAAIVALPTRLVAPPEQEFVNSTLKLGLLRIPASQSFARDRMINGIGLPTTKNHFRESNAD
jgi:hypothetical protein